MKARGFRVKCLVSFSSTSLCLERLHFAALHCVIISIPAIPNTMGWIKTAGEVLTTCCCGCCQTIWLGNKLLKKEIQTAEKSQGLVVPRGSSMLLKTKKLIWTTDKILQHCPISTLFSPWIASLILPSLKQQKCEVNILYIALYTKNYIHNTL